MITGQESQGQMQAVLVIVQSQDAEAALDSLGLLNLPALVRMASSGGFLRQGNTALWMAVRPEQLNQVMAALRATCHRRITYVPAYIEAAQLGSAFPVEVELGGAIVFVAEIDRYEVI